MRLRLRKANPIRLRVRQPNPTPPRSTRMSRARTFALLGFVAAGGGCVDIGGKDPSMRTARGFLNDQKVERLVMDRIAAMDEKLAASRVKAVSYDGVVLLVGQVSNAALRDLAEQAIRDVPEVRRIHNELQVSGTTSLMARANDDWLTTKVVSRFMASDKVNASRVKVVAEDSVVYLVGILPKAEASQAAEVASTVFGVSKVVKVFDYLDG